MSGLGHLFVIPTTEAGREYERQQAQDRAQQLVTGGMRLLGCTHTASCASVGQCAQRPLGT